MKTLFYGGTILTMDHARTAEAVLTENDTILAVGSLAELEAQAGDCQRVDLRGGALLPGFIDAHSHFFQVACSFMQASLDGADTVEEMAHRVGEFIQENQIAPGVWINARDYDNNLMPGLKNPTLAQLDSFAPNNPLVIHHKSGHMGLMNSLALEKLGITPETVAPEGGRIEIVDGKLTGYLEENAFIDFLKKIPMAGPEQLLQCMAKAQEKYASYGITTLQEGMVVEQMLPLYRMLMEQKILDLDIMLYLAPEAWPAAGKFLGELTPQDHVKAAGLKIFLDGSPQGRTAWMRQPYEGAEDGYCGYGTMTDEEVQAAFAYAGANHLQILCHCNGDGAAEQFLRCLAAAEEKYPNLAQLRPVLIHGQLLAPDQLPRLAQLGAMVSFFVAHTYHWGDVHLRNFGPERGNRISPAKSAKKAGVKFTFHQDAPVIEPDMLETVWCAVNRITKNGVALTADEHLRVEEALQAVTADGAYQYFAEEQIGTITPGKKADLVVLDRDPCAVEPMELRTIRVMRTYKNGKCVFSRT